MGDKKPFKKSEDCEVERRVRLAAEKITEGYDGASVSRYMAELVGCSIRQADRYVVRARKLIQARWEDVDRKEMAATILNKLDLIYQRSLEHRQYSASQAALASQAKIVGIDSSRG